MGKNKGLHVLELEGGRGFLVTVLNRKGDQVQVTGKPGGEIGACWVHKDQLHKASADERKELEGDAADPVTVDDQDDDQDDDDAGSSSGDDDAAAGDAGGSAA